MTRHTPGPWSAEPERASERREVAQLTDGRLRTWRIVHDGPEEGDAEADARLLAASEALYDAAVWVLHNAHGISKTGEDRVSFEEERASWDALMAATAKVEGR